MINDRDHRPLTQKGELEGLQEIVDLRRDIASLQARMDSDTLVDDEVMRSRCLGYVARFDSAHAKDNKRLERAHIRLVAGVAIGSINREINRIKQARLDELHAERMDAARMDAAAVRSANHPLRALFDSDNQARILAGVNGTPRSAEEQLKYELAQRTMSARRSLKRRAEGDDE